MKILDDSLHNLYEVKHKIGIIFSTKPYALQAMAFPIQIIPRSG
jgi:hypothetical protein